MTQRLIKQQRIAKASASFSSLLLVARFGTVASPAQAQITPDATLGTEASIVDRNVQIRGALGDRIRGGALRGANHFHSLSDFNVAGDQRVYFSNETSVENIITRVTGGNRSDIFGKLGVDGNANLFLINPNGIVFGQNAQLDIAGSFWAGTSDRVIFSNGESFGTTNPGVPALIEVNIPIGLQMGKNAPNIVRNDANLATGKDLRLTGSEVISNGALSAPQGQVSVEAVAGDTKVQQLQARSASLTAKQNLILENSKLTTTEDLALNAEDTVRVRDSVAKPIEVKAGKDLRIQGNQKIDILVLNHPITPFQAGGNLSLVSNGAISGDAHFTSGGNFSILSLAGQPGNFFSLYDPIIRSNTDVTFGAYTGASLKVEAAGSITATGAINITTPDTNILETGSDAEMLKNQPALILRSGTPIVAPNIPNIPPEQNAGGTTFTATPPPTITPGNITVQDITVGTPGTLGRIILAANNGGSINFNGGNIDANRGQTEIQATNIQVRATGTTANGTVDFNGGSVTGGVINGGTGNDIFNFKAGSIGVAVNGNDGDDTFSFSGGVATQSINGGGGVNILEGTNNSDIFTLTGPNSGTLQPSAASLPIIFDQMQQLRGRDGNDQFILNGGTFTRPIDAGAGTGDVVTSTSAAESFTITGPNQGSISSNSFQNIELFQGTGNDAVIGTLGADIFTIEAANTLRSNGIEFKGIQRVDGVGGDDRYELNNGVPSNAVAINDSGTINSIDELSYANYQTPVNVDLSSSIDAIGIEQIQGSTQAGIASTLTSRNSLNIWVAGDNTTPGTINGDTRFRNFTRLIGGDFDDTFTLNPGASVQSINGRFGNNTIIGSNMSDNFTVSGFNFGDVNGISFQNIENLQGGGGDDTFLSQFSSSINRIQGDAGNDTFNLNGGNISQPIEGGADSDTIASTGNFQLINNGLININLAPINFSNIEQFDGTGSNDRLIGTTLNDIFALVNPTDINAGIFSFRNFENLSGGSGNNTLLGVNNSNEFTLRAVNSGTLRPQGGGLINFDQMQILQGGNSDDRFILAGGTVGEINAGSGNDTISGEDIDNDNILVRPDGSGFFNGMLFQNVEIFEGRGGDDTIRLLASSALTQPLSFNGGPGIDTLIATDNDENFSIGTLTLPGIQVSNVESLDGGGGNDTLSGSTGNDSFNINGINRGSVGSLQFSNIANLQGLDGNDRFNFALASNITGITSGDFGNDFFNFQGSSVSGNVSGGDGNDTFSTNFATLTGNLLGDADDDTFNFGIGDVRGVVQGGTGNDIFNFNPGVSVPGSTFNSRVTGNVLGEAGDDTFNLNGGTVTGQLLGGTDTDLIRGGNGADIFQLSRLDSGDVNGIIFFSGVEQFDGGVGNDTLLGTLNADNFIITSSLFSTPSGFQAQNFETIDGRAGNDTFTVQSGTTPTLTGGLGDDTVTVAGGTVSNLRLDEGNDSLTIANGNVSTADMGAGNNQVSVTGGTIGSLKFGNGLDKLTLGTGNGSIGTVLFGTGDDEVILSPGTTRSQIAGSLTASSSRLTIIADDTLQGLPTSPNAISGTGELLVRPSSATHIAFNPGAIAPNILSVIPTNLQSIRNGFSQVIFAANEIGFDTNITTSGHNLQFLAQAGNITGGNSTLNVNNGNLLLSASQNIDLTNSAVNTTSGNSTVNVNNGNLLLFASQNIDLTNSAVNTTSGNITLTAPSINLKAASKISSTSGNIGVTTKALNLEGNSPAALDTPTSELSKPRADRAEIATRSFTPGVASGNLNITTTDLTLDNAALIAETGRGANNGNVNIAFPNPLPPNAAPPNAAPVARGKLEMKNNSLILAQGDRPTSGDVRITGEALVIASPKSPIEQDGNDIITNANPDRGGGAILLESVDAPGRTSKPLAQSFVDVGFSPTKKPRDTINDLSSNAAIDLPPPSTKTPTERPTQFVDPNKLVSSGCQPNANKTDRQSQFTIAGKGGLPSNPLTVLRPESTQDDWVTMPESTRPPAQRPQITAQGDPPNAIASPKLAQKLKQGECVESWTQHHQ
jgi:filamentous hemagglutinin family protein